SDELVSWSLRSQRHQDPLVENRRVQAPFGSPPWFDRERSLLESFACTLKGEYDVVMPDAGGHGNSSTPLNGYRYNDHANDVVGLIQGLGLVAPVLLGHSMGGMTAAVVASEVATAIRGVILADPTFLSPQWQRE